MKHVVEAGTDAAEVILFDPASLPEDFDARVQDDPASLFEQLMGEGLVFVTETGGDGRFLLHTYVSEPVPALLQPHAHDPRRVERFLVTSGRLCFAGVEYAYRSDDSFLQKYPHMGCFFELPPGTYRLTLYRMEYPDGLQERALRTDVGQFKYWLHRSMGMLVLVAVVSLVGLVVGYFNLGRDPAAAALLLGMAFLVAVPFIVYRSKPFQEAQKCYEQIQREHPSLVAHLEAVG